MNLWEKIKSSNRMAKYQQTVIDLPNNPNQRQTVDKILNEIDRKDYASFANLFGFHAKEALSKGNVSLNAFYAGWEKYVENS